MYISKEKFEEIKKNYSTLILSDSNAVDALNFVSDIMKSEAEAIKEKVPYATASIDRLDTSAYEAFSIGGDIENEIFDEKE